MLRSACCGSPWRPVHSAGTLPMYSSGFREHPCSEKSPVRDYSPKADASLLREIPFQGLFSRDESIPARRNPPPGIISRGESIPARRNSPSGIIFPRRKHPCSEKSPVRDYFSEADASLLEEISRQGLFSRGESIPARRNSFSRIIFPRRMHPCSEKSPVRDYFPEVGSLPAIIYRPQQNQENTS